MHKVRNTLGLGQLPATARTENGNASGRPWWRKEDAARRDVGGWNLLLGDLELEVLLDLPHLLPT
jgi:hypothetical protein